MVKPIIIANWKMNLAGKEAIRLAGKIKEKTKGIINKEIVICSSFTDLASVGATLRGSGLRLGAQDVFWEDAGAYTGAISPLILKAAGCDYVIVGHSERRQYLGETDEMVNKKVSACLQHGLTPIICVGETFEERQQGETNNIILSQLNRILDKVDLIEDEQVIIAYEPVWVIGSGQAVDPAEADSVFHLIRQTLVDLWPIVIVNQNVRLIYGGSVDADNVSNFARLDLCHGFLVGGASLEADRFVEIIKSL